MPEKDNAQPYPHRKDNTAFYAEKLLVGLYRQSLPLQYLETIRQCHL